ncbi:hypothetical protein [Nocardioides deserti]|uniref:DNA-directed RNA polymerase specialized sigma24 family protein n=1 Tax=Nocardioides deserti TaxID=1588644 RepID=A0ABR6U6K5_9ACTN|nr:hypothetical protein [Nocardioides deserti]MBC2959998.1 hypothetical protein [Nocardioides deserti]GGO75233.1 hypothetical protein GCM10012276_25100 [Nocardioides deserti]
MRAADDFPDYLAARWAPLVRVAVLLGWSRALAERIVAAALGSCRRDWRELSDTGDLDGEVLATLAATTAQARRHGLGPDGPEDPADPTDDGAVDHHVATYAALDALPDRERTRLVVAAVLGRGRTDHAALLDDVRRVAAAVRVGPAPGPEELPTRLVPRRTGRLVVVGVAVVGLLVAATYALGVVRPDGTGGPDDPDGRGVQRLAPVEVEEAPNPVPVSWWADGVLHLAAVSLRVPGVVDLAEVHDGAVVTDDDGRVVRVREDGERALLGRHVGGSGLAADEGTTIAWIEPDGTVVVHDLFTDRDVDRRRLDIVDLATVRVVSLDGGAVHLTSSYGDVRWAPGDTSTTVAQPPVLVDRASGATLSRVGPGTVRVEQPFFSVGFTRPGDGGSISPDGSVVVTTTADDRSAYGTVRAYDTRSGERLPTGLGPDDVALALEPGRPDLVTYVVAPPATSGRLELRSCRLRTGRCRSHLALPASDGVPVLAAR